MEFIPGAGFLVFFLVSLFTASVLQLILVIFLYQPVKVLIAVLIIYAIVSILLFIYCSTISTALLLSGGFLMFWIVNWMTYKKVFNG